MFHRVKPDSEPDSKKEQGRETGATNAPGQGNTQQLSNQSAKVQEQGNTGPSEAAGQNSNVQTAASQATQATQSQNKEGQSSAMNKPQDTTESKENPAAENSAQSQQKSDEAPSGTTYSARPAARPAHGAAGGYSASPGYAGTAPYGAPQGGMQTQGQQGSSDNSSLTIGPGISMSGEIEACEHIVVQGTVEAALKGARILDIEEGGTFYGTVEIEEATLAGRFEGDITVRGRLSIRETGVITGSITYGELEVEAGATIDGRMTPVSAARADNAAPQGKQESSAARSSKQAKAAKSQSQEPANTEGELFTKKAAAE